MIEIDILQDYKYTNSKPDRNYYQNQNEQQPTKV